VEGTVLLAPVSFGAPPADTARATTHVDTHTLNSGIGARLDTSARLLEESIDELRSLDH
jgi:hypothetical protein